MSTVDPNNIVLVYRTTNAVEAHTIANHLDDAAIESQVVGDFLDGAYAGLNLGRMGDKEVWVAAKDEDAAAAVVAEWRREHPLDQLEDSRSIPLVLKIMLVIALLWLLLIGIG
jgi:hypothetical protein